MNQECFLCAMPAAEYQPFGGHEAVPLCWHHALSRKQWKRTTLLAYSQPVKESHTYGGDVDRNTTGLVVNISSQPYEVYRSYTTEKGSAAAIVCPARTALARVSMGSHQAFAHWKTISIKEALTRERTVFLVVDAPDGSQVALDMMTIYS